MTNDQLYTIMTLCKHRLGVTVIQSLYTSQMLSSVGSRTSACLNIPNAAKHFQICQIKKTSYLKWVKCRWSRGVVGHLVPIRLTLAKPPEKTHRMKKT